MAKQYVITEEEMLSLIDQLRLTEMSDKNIWRDDLSKPITADQMHRAFHYVVVRWAQAMGFSGHR